MKKILTMKNFIGFIAVALAFSLTMFSTNSSAYAASSSTAEVTHVEVSWNGEEIKELKDESFTYPVGEEFENYMSSFDGYVKTGVSSSSISIGGIERVVAKVEWQKIEDKEVVETEEIPYETVEKEDSTLDKGEEVVDQEGVVGERKVTYKVSYIGGVERNREEISEEVTVEPTEEIIRVGTKVTEEKEEQQTEEIPYETVEKEDPTLDKGEEVVDQEGVNGERTITYNVTYVNGEETKREAVSEEIIAEPIDEVILVGTKDVIELKEEKEKEEIPYETITKEDSDLDKGKEVVDQEGIAGEKTVIYEITYVNGEETKREVLSEEKIKKPVDEIILVGTKEVKSDEVEEGSNGSDESNEAEEGSNGSDESNEAEEGSNGSDESDEAGEGSNGNDESNETEEGSNENGESDKTDQGLIGKSDDKDNGNLLPQTASSVFNWMVGGFAALIAGLIGVFTTRRKVSR